MRCNRKLLKWNEASTGVDALFAFTGFTSLHVSERFLAVGKL